MSQRLRKIGWEKASVFNKNFDKVYDYWKNKAINDYNYFDELKLIKEHNKVFIYLILPDIDSYTEREDWHEPYNPDDNDE